MTIVSHRYDLGDWAPDASGEVEIANQVHRLYLWHVPDRRGRSL